MTGWTELAAGLNPSANMAAREQQAWLVEQVRAGHSPPLEWFNVSTTWNGYVATFRVSNQVRVGDADDSVLPFVSAVTAQTLADDAGAVLSTPLLHDAIASQGYLISYVDDVYANVADLSARQMVDNSHAIDRKRPESGLWTVGKGWKPHAWYNNPAAAGLRNGANTGINYGAHTRKPVGAGGANPWRSVSLPAELRVWQPPGGRGKKWHSLWHGDISQKAPHLVARQVLLITPTGQASNVDVEELAGDAELWRLVSASGPLDSMRIPIEAATGGTPPPRPPPGGDVIPVGRPAGAGTGALALATFGAIGLGAFLWYAWA